MQECSDPIGPDAGDTGYRARVSRGTDRALHNAVLEQNVPGRRLLLDAGWQETWRGVRMIRGEPLDWHPDAIYGQFNFGLG